MQVSQGNQVPTCKLFLASFVFEAACDLPKEIVPLLRQSWSTAYHDTGRTESTVLAARTLLEQVFSVPIDTSKIVITGIDEGSLNVLSEIKDDDSQTKPAEDLSKQLQVDCNLFTSPPPQVLGNWTDNISYIF